MLKKYILSEDAVENQIGTVLMIVVTIAGVLAVGGMIFAAIQHGKDAMGADFVQGG